MKKHLIVASLAALIVSSAFAGKPGDVGVSLEFGGLKSDATAKVDGISSDGDIHTTYEALRAGKYFDFGRIGGSLGYINEDDGTDGKFVAINYDYMFYNKSQFTPFVGASVAYNWNEANYNIKHNGLTYGPEVGVVYDVTKEVELELGARYLKSNVDGSKNVSGHRVSLDVDSSVQYYMAIGYKF